MKEDLIQRHESLWKGDENIEVVRAPGRINLIGEHIDYHGGIVLPAAIDRAIYMSISGASGGTEVYSMDLDAWYRTRSNTNPSWGGYIEHLIRIAREQGLELGAFHGVIHSKLPVGAGLSSSAALTSGFIYGLDRLYNWGLTRLEMAEFGQAIEHALGVQCGLMDQYAVIHGKKDHVIKLDCLINDHTYHRAELGHAKLFLLNSGVSHNLADSAYNDRRRVTQQGLMTIQQQFAHVGSYRDVTHEIIAKTHAMDDEQVRLARYIVEEMQRVNQTVAALSTGDTSEFGDNLSQTHVGLRDLYQVTCAETDYLFDLAKANTDILGARQMGGGFGGCVMVLAEEASARETLADMCDKYKAHTGIEVDPIEVAISDGVGLI